VAVSGPRRGGHPPPPTPPAPARAGGAGDYTTPAIVERGKPYWPNLLWTLRGGQRCPPFPPEVYPLNRPLEKVPAYLQAE
jgi:hypothetical protein